MRVVSGGRTHRLVHALLTLGATRWAGRRSLWLIERVWFLDGWSIVERPSRMGTPVRVLTG
jgi:hypothetical protein